MSRKEVKVLLEKLNEAISLEWGGVSSILLDGGSHPDGSWRDVTVQGCSEEVQTLLEHFNHAVNEAHKQNLRWEYIVVDRLPEGVTDAEGRPQNTAIAPCIVDITIDLY